jgi:hypothetical protein
MILSIKKDREVFGQRNLQVRKMEPSKKAMRDAYLARNAHLSREKEELQSTIKALIGQRNEAIQLAKERGEALAIAQAEIETLKKLGLRVQVWKVSEPEPVKAKVITLSKPEPVEQREDRKPFGVKVQAAVAHFLRDWGLAPWEPKEAAWDMAYKINGALLNGGNKFSLDEILVAVKWLEFSMGEKGYFIEETRKYLVMLDETEDGELQRAAQCELVFLNLAFPPEQQKTDVKEAEAVIA